MTDAVPDAAADHGSPVANQPLSRQFRLFYAGTVLSMVAQWMIQFALGWLVVELAIEEGHPERSALYVGLIGLVRLVPAATVGILGGVAADRFDRRRLLVLMRTVSASVAGAAAILTLMQVINIPLVILMAMILGGAFAFDVPNRISLTQALVPASSAYRALGLMRLAQQTSTIVGPLAGGLLVPFVGIGGVLVVDCVLYALSGLGLRRLQPSPPAAASRSIGPWVALRQGINYTVSDPTLRSFLGMQLLVAVFASSFSQLLPVVVHETFGLGAFDLSLLVAAVGVGAVVGAVGVLNMARWRRPGHVLMVDAVILGLAMLAFSRQDAFGPALALCVVIGAGTMIYNGGSGNVVQVLPPDHIKGRVVGVQSTLYNTGVQLGVLVLGVLGSLIGISGAIAVAGVILLLSGMAIVRIPRIREFRMAFA